jgi:hypothetical protein
MTMMSRLSVLIANSGIVRVIAHMSD